MKERYTSLQIISLMGITLIGILISVVEKIPLVLGFLPGYFYVVWLVRHQAGSAAEIQRVSLVGIFRAKNVLLILFLVSLLLPAWHASGTLGQLVDICTAVITPRHFLLLTFLASLGLSMMLGTCVGTLSSIGVPILASATALDVPLEMAAGALVSGAFVGDRTSPFSSAHQLLAHTVEISVKQQFRAMRVTTVTAVAAAAFFYLLLDAKMQPSHGHHAVFQVKEGWLLLPPVLLISAVILRLPIIYGFLISIAAASLMALYGGLTIYELFHSFLFGIDGTGGIKGMYALLLFIALASAYNGIIEKYEVMQPTLNRWLTGGDSLPVYTGKVLLATMGISLIAANQTLPIILTGRSFMPQWSLRHKREELARVMADSTIVFPGMIPWSVLCIMCSTILKLPVSAYLPYAIFLWILPILTMGVSVHKGRQMSFRFQENTKSKRVGL